MSGATSSSNHDNDSPKFQEINKKVSFYDEKDGNGEEFTITNNLCTNLNNHPNNLNNNCDKPYFTTVSPKTSPTKLAPESSIYSQKSPNKFSLHSYKTFPNTKYDYKSKCADNKLEAPATSASCYFDNNNKTSTQSNTILITHNLSENDMKLSKKSSSSITIVTHNKHHDEIETKSVLTKSDTNGPVVVDRINICINNHFGAGTGDINNLSTNQNIKDQTSESIEPDSTTQFTTPPKKTIKNIGQFQHGQDVLVQKKDQKFYLGTVIQIQSDQCLIKFDDNTEHWADFQDISKLNTFNDVNSSPMCVNCKQTNEQDVVELCERCGRGFHRKCCGWDNGVWTCKRCDSENGPADKLKFRRKLDIYEFDELREAEINTKFCISTTHKIQRQLPYDLNALHWDKKHHVNAEQIYCYCGKNGSWENKMLQCLKCQQWFHEKCIKVLKYPLYVGDRFYAFICKLCHGGTEFLRRLEMSWSDLVQLILFNLTVSSNKTYHHINKGIIQYALDHWKNLHLTNSILNCSEDEIKKQLQNTLIKGGSLFKNGREINKSKSFWGLRYRLPPVQSQLKLSIIPMNINVNDQYLKNEMKLNFIPQKCHSPVNSDDERDLKFTSEDEVPIKKILVKDNKTNKVTNDDKEDLNENTLLKSNGERVKHSRKRPTLYSTALPMDHLYDSSDDTTSSSLGTLDLIIPPPKNFQGQNNPFRLTPKKNDLNNKLNTSGALKKLNKNSNQYNNKMIDLSSKLVAIKKSGNQLFSNINTAGQFRIVRTVKRRLSAKDIFIGPNNNIKKRKLRKSSGSNLEVISTTIETLPSYNNKLKIRQDLYPPLALGNATSSLGLVKSNQQINSTQITSSSTNSSSATTTKLDINANTNLFNNTVNSSSKKPISRRNLRKRDNNIHYFENPRRNSNSSVATTICSNQSLIINNQMLPTTSNQNGSNGNSTINSSPNSPNNTKNCDNQTMSELQTSVNMYFGALERIKNGENFSVYAKRKLPNGKTQYLIEWDCGGSLTSYSQ